MIFMPVNFIFPFVGKLLKHIKRIKNVFCVIDKNHVFRDRYILIKHIN